MAAGTPREQLSLEQIVVLLENAHVALTKLREEIGRVTEELSSQLDELNKEKN
jgi:hypothetical protein